MDVNTYLMEVFGYAIAPINYGTKTSLFENSSFQFFSWFIRFHQGIGFNQCDW